MNDFSFVRQNTDVQDISSQLSMSMPIQSKKLQAQKKTNHLINKALRYMDKSKDFIQFTKKIMIPKVKRNLFLEEEQRKKNERMTQRLLSNGLKGFAKVRNNKYNDQHNIYDDPTQQKSAKRYESLKGRRRRDRTPIDQQKAKSLSKIQLLTNKQRQQTILDEKYDNENYIFLNLKKMGQSRDLSEQVSQEQSLQKNKKDVRFKRNKNQLSISLNIDNPNRPKVKSVDKHDRERLKMIQSGVKFGNNFATGKTHSYRKQSQVDTQTNDEKATSMGALFKLFPIKSTPKNNKNQKNDSIVTGLRSLLGMNTGKHTAMNRSPSRNSQKGISRISQNTFLQQLQQIKRFYQKSKQTSDCLYNLLSSISKQKNRDTIRIYREDFAKIYGHRYGRDRITQFFDYEYIEDYNSLLQLFTSTVLNFNQNQVMLISFMLLDFDNDGLISHSDLFNLLTLMDNNQLAKKTIYKLIKYVHQHVEKQKMGIKDTCQDDYMRKQNFTLKKYRFITYMKEKKSNQSHCSKQASSIYKLNSRHQQQQQSSSVMNLQNKFTSYDRSPNNRHNKLTNNSSSIYRQHFSFKKPQKTGEQVTNDFKILRAFLQSMAKSSQVLANGVSFFWINFQRLKTIYKQAVPQIYYDMLYSSFGLQMKGIKYDKIDVDSPLRKQRKCSLLEQQQQNDDELGLLYENLSQMRFTKEDLKIKQLRPDIKRRRKIKTVLE